MIPLPPHPRSLLALLLITAVTAGCSPAQEKSPQATTVPPSPTELEARRSEVLERGSSVVSQAGKALSGILLEAIRQGGPTNALPLCSVQAIPLTSSLAQAHNVQLRRVSHRARNPLNQANATEQALIENFNAQLASGTKPLPEVLITQSGTALFYAPIIINTNLCLRCHGEPGVDLDPAVTSLLQTLYPQDKAIGFALGDLRGLWRVDFPPGALRAP